MNKLTTTILVLAAAVLLTSTLGFGALDTATVEVNLTVAGYQTLRVKSQEGNPSQSSITNTYQVPEPTQRQLENGYVQENDAVEFIAASNMDWAVQIKAEDDYLTGRDGGYRKPISDLSVRAHGEFVPVGISPQTIASGEPGRHEFGVDYRVSYSEDEPKTGDYEAKLTYTISAN